MRNHSRGRAFNLAVFHYASNETNTVVVFNSKQQQTLKHTGVCLHKDATNADGRPCGPHPFILLRSHCFHVLLRYIYVCIYIYMYMYYQEKRAFLTIFRVRCLFVGIHSQSNVSYFHTADWGFLFFTGPLPWKFEGKKEASEAAAECSAASPRGVKATPVCIPIHSAEDRQPIRSACGVIDRCVGQLKSMMGGAKL